MILKSEWKKRRIDEPVALIMKIWVDEVRWYRQRTEFIDWNEL